MGYVLPLSEQSAATNHIVKTLKRLGLPVTRENYLILLCPNTELNELPEDIEQYLPPFLRRK